MTTTLAQGEDIYKCSAGDLAVPLRLRQRALGADRTEVATWCLHAIAEEYSQQVKSKKYQGSIWTLSVDQFERSLCRNISLESEQEWVRGRVFDALANSLWLKSDYLQARHYYLASLSRRPWAIAIYVKFAFVLLKIPAGFLRDFHQHLNPAR